MKSTTIFVPMLLLAVVLLTSNVEGGSIKITSSAQNWMSVVNGLVPGDTLYFQPGTYTYASNFNVNLTGTPTSPITLTGYTNATRPIFKVQGNRNCVNIVEGNYLIFDYLEIDGSQGVDASTEGVRLGSPTSRVSNSIFRNLVIHDTGSSGFTANFGGAGTFTNLTIVHNEVYNTGSGTGECFYLGCSNDACRIANSIIANNYCHNTTLANGGSIGSGIQVKPGSYNNIIQDNVCHFLKSVCVLLYDDYDRGANQAIGNLFVGGTDNGIQADAGVEIINNIIVNVTGSGIAISNPIDLQTGKTFRNITIRHNTIVNATAGCLYLSGISSTTSWNVANNALYCPGGFAVNVASYQGSPTKLSPGLLYNNVVLHGTTLVAGAQFLAYLNSSGPFVDMVNPSPTTLNFYPTGSGALPNAGNPAYSWAYDWNDNPRSTTTPTVGAFEYSAGNPGGPVNPRTFKSNSTNYAPPGTSTGGSSTTVSGSSGPSGSSTSSSAGGLRNFKAEWLHKLRTEYHLVI